MCCLATRRTLSVVLMSSADLHDELYSDMTEFSNILSYELCSVVVAHTNNDMR